MTRADAIRMLRKKLRDTELSQAQFAKKYELNEQFFGQVLIGKKAPSPKILKVIGLERIVRTIETFRPIDNAETNPHEGRSTHGSL